METQTKKRGRPFKIDENNVIEFLSNIEKKLNPITFILQVNGETTITSPTNVLQSLREISIPPTSIKTMSVFHFELNGKVYHRVLKIQQMKMLLGNNMRKIMTAKVINTTLGLSGEDLYK